MATSKTKSKASTNGHGHLQAASIDDLLSNKLPMTAEVVIYLDDEGPEKINQARRELERTRVLQRDDEEAIAEAKTKLEEAQTEARERARVMTFRAIGRKAYDRLILAHPPTEEQNKEHREATATKENPKGQSAPYNSDTFPQALVAASLIDPKLTLEQVNQIWDEWNSGELTELFLTAINVNSNRRVAELGN